MHRATNIHWQGLEVDKNAHCALNGHRPRVLWLTGLSGAGKSTIADLVEQRLFSAGVHTCVLDGDNVRHGLNCDLGFSAEDRDENVRRVAEVAKLMVQSGLIVIAAFISPLRAERDAARALFEPCEFVEIFVDAPLELARRATPRGTTARRARARSKGLTGIDAPYEPPLQPELRLDTAAGTPEDAAQAILDHLRATGLYEATAAER